MLNPPMWQSIPWGDSGARTAPPPPHAEDVDAPVAHRGPVAGTPSGDRQLVRAVALGDPRAWDALVAEYAGAVWATCLRSGLRADEAAAASALVWMHLADAIPHLDAPVGRWLVTAAADEAHQALVRAGGRRAGLVREKERRARPRTAPGRLS